MDSETASKARIAVIPTPNHVDRAKSCYAVNSILALLKVAVSANTIAPLHT